MAGTRGSDCESQINVLLGSDTPKSHDESGKCDFHVARAACTAHRADHMLALVNPGSSVTAACFVELLYKDLKKFLHAAEQIDTGRWLM